MTHGEGSKGTVGVTTCQASTKAGTPCRFPPMKDGSGYCFRHNPATAKERRSADSRGGQRTAAKRSALLGQLDFSTAEGCRVFLESLVSAAITDTIASSKARDVAAICQVALSVRQGAEMADRLDVLEREIRGIVQEAAQGGPV